MLKTLITSLMIKPAPTPVWRSAAVEGKQGVCVERHNAVEQGRAVMYTHAHKMSRTFLSRAFSNKYI